MGPLATIDRYWQTLRWLRPVQIYGRLWFRVARPRPDTRPAPPLREPSGTWAEPAPRAASLTGPGAFLFLNQPGDLAQCGWDDPSRDKLWRYNQHYFDDLNAEGAPARVAWHAELLDNWIAHNPPGQGTGWEPYPTSLRIVNWIKWALAGNTLDDTRRQSLAVQVRWLRKRLEWHLLGNHLLANAKALIFAGLWFDGPEAQVWLDKGLEILADQIPQQILPDGGQFELSPMYHALALEDVLDLVNVCRLYAGSLIPDQAGLLAWLTALTPSMQDWLAALTHPDGRIAFFNDAAFGVAPENDELTAYACRLAFDPSSKPGGLVWLPNSGYTRLSKDNAVLIADLARVGPDYLPSHAHADSLSFELSIHGHRVIVNSGTSVYGASSERLRQRGTEAHSTVVVEGQNSSDVWGGFRVGRRAVPRDRRTVGEGGSLTAEASHDGYRHLPGAPTHRRRWTLSPGTLRIVDEVEPGKAEAEARFHLHPGIEIEQMDTNGGTLRLPAGQTIRWTASGGAARLEPTSWHPEFGADVSCFCLVIRLKGHQSVLDLFWG